MNGRHIKYPRFLYVEKVDDSLIRSGTIEKVIRRVIRIELTDDQSCQLQYTEPEETLHVISVQTT